MNITVAGLWRLGAVTAACCSRHFSVTGFDPNPDTIDQLNQGVPPLFEPELSERIRAGFDLSQLRFTASPKDACASADILWVTFDTPVDDHDQSDVASVQHHLQPCLRNLPENALVVISSQLPVGTCRDLESEYPNLHFACSPENLRLGRAIESFEKADRVVVGLRNQSKQPLLQTLFNPFTSKILWMRTESAEMVKHSLNSFLALSITYINEIASLCEQTGADAGEVSAGLKSDPRIGAKAYLRAGGPFSGGTLARDVVTLNQIATRNEQTIPLLAAIKQSNDHHRGWNLRRLTSQLSGLSGKTIALLGLTYTPNTDTLRRSAAVELCNKLLDAGASVTAFDPAVKKLPDDLSQVKLTPNIQDALCQADAVVISTEWPEFKQAHWEDLLLTMRQPVVIDPNRFLEKELKNIPGVDYLYVGRP